MFRLGSGQHKLQRVVKINSQDMLPDLHLSVALNWSNRATNHTTEGNRKDRLVSFHKENASTQLVSYQLGVEYDRSY